MLIALAAVPAWAGPWSVLAGPDVRIDGDAVTLRLPVAGTAAAAIAPFPVTARSRRVLRLAYTGTGLGPRARLAIVVRWLGADGADLDAARAARGFPPLAVVLDLGRDAPVPVAVADTLAVPDGATAARVEARLEGVPAGAAPHARIDGVALGGGEVPTTGVVRPASGPPDAGPLSSPDPATAFVPNLVPNGALEDGGDAPVGWRVAGDNANAAAVWRAGGCFSGRRCLAVADRAPFVRSWDRRPRDPWVPGRDPAGNYAYARAEVAGRWVSDPQPAVPGTAYQASAFVWYAERAFANRGSVSPLRVQFLDRRGRELPAETVWDDWLPDGTPFERPGWVMVRTKPRIAPPRARSVRVAVALAHAFYQASGAVVRELPDARREVLVDDVALWALPPGAGDDAERAFWAAADAGRLPFVPTSPAHRPGTVDFASATAWAGGIVFVDRDAPPAPLAGLGLQGVNVTSDTRALAVAWTIADWRGAEVARGSLPARLPAFGRATFAVDGVPPLPYGPYVLRWSAAEDGGAADAGETRFAVLAPKETTPAERGRMDYPFGLWAPTFGRVLGTPEEDTIGRLVDAAGAGKTWFGAGGSILVQDLLAIRSPRRRAAAIAERVARARRGIAAWRRFGVTPMGHLEAPQLLKSFRHRELREVVGALVGALAPDIDVWRWGTEQMHGGVDALDVATVLEDGKPRDYLFYGRQGTVREWWGEYLAARAAAKAADPSCRFGPQSASDVAGNVLRLFFQVAGPHDLDFFGMNTYIDPAKIWTPNRAVLAGADVPDLPLVASEFDPGTRCARCVPTDPDRVREEAEMARRTVTVWTKILHDFPTFAHLEQWGMVLGNDAGSLTYLGRVRPHFVAFAVMTEALGAGRFVARFDPPGAVVTVRERTVRPGRVAVAWATGGATSVTFAVDASSVVVADLWGNRRALPTAGGRVTLALDAMPQYVLGAGDLRVVPQ